MDAEAGIRLKPESYLDQNSYNISWIPLDDRAW